MLLLSFGSGVAALIYEIVWFQILELVIGSSAVSLGLLLATFMGGTCLGSLILPRLIPPRYDPLRIYAAIETGIAFLAILVLMLTPAGYGLKSLLLRGAVAAGCLMPPTVLMGATLPMLSRRVETSRYGMSWAGFFYCANIVGAVVGCLAAGFYLLRKFDVMTATYVAASINAAMAAIGWFASDSLPPAARAALPLFPGESNGRTNCDWGSIKLPVYIAIALSGLCAMAAETIWTRLLGLLFGASVYTLSIVVAVFLAGLGIGSSIGSLLCRTIRRPSLALGCCQLLCAGAIAWTAYILGAALPFWPINPSLTSNIWFTFQLDMNRAVWALLPPTLLWGASFPLALAAVRSKARDAGILVGGVYAANTLGAIVGALCATLLLIAWIGTQRSEQLLIALSMVSGLCLLIPQVSSAKLRIAAWSLSAIVLAALLINSVPPISKLLVAHGRYAATWAGKSDIVYAREGLNASVAVSNFPGGARTFHVAGKIQASNVPRDMRLQRMLGHLTTLTTVHPRSVLVIGCGAGITAGAVSVDPRVERLSIVEIERIVPEAAAAYFGENNFDVLRNPKVQVHIDDGRHYLLTTSERFDAITADPLDPWVKGAANLYTKEFFEVVKQRLNPGGVVTMYIQLFETNKEAVQTSLATFFEVFPNGSVWGNTYEGRGHDMVLLGQTGPLHIDVDQIERRLQTPDYMRVAQSLGEVGMQSAIDLFDTYAGRGSDLKEWLRGVPINRDRNLRMQYLAGMGLDADDSAAIYADILAYRRFPEDMFTGSEASVTALKQAGNWGQ
jgi:spermidine synthase